MKTAGDVTLSSSSFCLHLSSFDSAVCRTGYAATGRNVILHSASRLITTLRYPARFAASLERYDSRSVPAKWSCAPIGDPFMLVVAGVVALLRLLRIRNAR